VTGLNTIEIKQKACSHQQVDGKLTIGLGRLSGGVGQLL
jgi:hypothetical protein